MTKREKELNKRKKEVKKSITSLDTLDDKVNQFAFQVDVAFHTGDIEMIDYLIDLMLKFIKKNNKSLESLGLATLYYFIGNAWADATGILLRIENKEELILYRLKKDEKGEDYHRENALFAYRKAHSLDGFFDLSEIRKCQILVNLGNQLSEVGRIVEAVEYWERAKVIKPDFTMAIGNHAYGLYKYGSIVFDEGHQALFLDTIAKRFRELKRDENIHDEAWNFFIHYKKIVGDEPVKLKDSFSWDNYDLGNKIETDYRKWVGSNKLFLNTLNDISTANLALRDALMLPTIVTPINVGNKYHSMFNQLKQEFVSARYFLYEGLISESTHFSDKEVAQYNSLDYTALSLNVEKVKVAYRMCYSIIDKVSFFLIDYFDLDIEQDNSDSNLTNTINELEKEGFLKTNWELTAIKWLNRDINENRYQKYLDPDTKKLKEIRNHLEHKYLKVSDYWTIEGRIEDEKGLNDTVSYYINRDDFNSKALKLFKLVRSLILYMTFSIHLNEIEKAKGRDESKIMPMFTDVIDDNWKR